MQIRDLLRRLFRQPSPMPERIDYSYRVFWTRQARGWAAARRRAILASARAVAMSDDFEPNAFERRYRLEGVDGQHSGASALALIRVMEALDADE